MFAHTYFASRYFAPRYFPPVAAGPSPPPPPSPPSGDGDYFYRREIGGRRRKRGKPDWQAADEKRATLEDEVRELYEFIVEGKRPPAKVARAVAEAVTPFAENAPKGQPRHALPPVQFVDFSALIANIGALDRLFDAFARTKAAEAAAQLRARQAEEALEADDLEAIRAFVEQLQ